MGLNETFQLVFTVSGGQSGEPDFSPLNKDFQLLGTSSSSQISMINGDTTQSKKYTLTVAPKSAGELVIPPITFGSEQSSASSIQVLERAPAAPDTPGVADELMLTASVDVADPYVQQQVLLTVKIYRRINWQQASLSELDADGSDLLVQQLGEDKQYRTTLEGRAWEVIERKFALFPQLSGDLVINPFRLTVAVADERPQGGRGYNDPFDRFFSRRPMVQKVARSDAIRLQVKPAVNGVVPWLTARDLKLQENWSVDPEQLQAGESVTRTVAIIADGVSVGQLPELKMDELEAVKVYPDQPQTNEQASSQGLLSTSSQKFALIPASGGEFEIPQLEVNWWNVSLDRMETARLPSRVLRVRGAAAPVAGLEPPVQVQAPPAAGTGSTDLCPCRRNNPVIGCCCPMPYCWCCGLSPCLPGGKAEKPGRRFQRKQPRKNGILPGVSCSKCWIKQCWRRMRRLPGMPYFSCRNTSGRIIHPSAWRRWCFAPKGHWPGN